MYSVKKIWKSAEEQKKGLKKKKDTKKLDDALNPDQPLLRRCARPSRLLRGWHGFIRTQPLPPGVSSSWPLSLLTLLSAPRAWRDLRPTPASCLPRPVPPPIGSQPPGPSASLTTSNTPSPPVLSFSRPGGRGLRGVCDIFCINMIKCWRNRWKKQKTQIPSAN